MQNTSHILNRSCLLFNSDYLRSGQLEHTHVLVHALRYNGSQCCLSTFDICAGLFEIFQITCHSLRFVCYSETIFDFVKSVILWILRFSFYTIMRLFCILWMNLAADIISYTSVCFLFCFHELCSSSDINWQVLCCNL